MPLYSLTQRADFLRLRHGKSFSSKSFKAQVLFNEVPLKKTISSLQLDSDSPSIYIGYTVTKRLFKKAVDRNRCKRRLRALMRFLEPSLIESTKKPLMVNFLVRDGALTRSFEDLQEDGQAFVEFLKKAGQLT